MRLLFLAILLTTPSPYQSLAKESIRYEGQRQIEAYAREHQAPPQLVIATLAEQQTDATTSKGNAYDASKDTLYRVYLLAAIVSTLVSIAALGFIYRQAQATADAAEGAAASAEAARAQARAMVNAERPWIIASLTRHPVNLITVLGEPPRPRKLDTEFSFAIKNIGKTPAKMLSVYLMHEYTKVGGTLKVPVFYGDAIGFEQQRILVSDESWEYGPATLKMNTLENADEILGNKLWYWRFGRVRYANLLDGREHETRFCWLYSLIEDDFVIAGPAEYTQYK